MNSRNLKARMQLVLGVVIALVFCARSAQAQYTINFDENGKGFIQTTAGMQPLQSLGNIPDPFDPSNGLFPLAYNLGAVIPPGVVPTAGDIDLIESDGTHSDLLRWTQSAAQGPLLLVYSDRPESSGETPDKADVGIPTILRQMPLLTLPETGPENGLNGLFGYKPNATDPGFFPVPVPPGGPVTYNFISDRGTGVPEPSSAALALLVGCALLVRRRRAA